MRFVWSSFHNGKDLSQIFLPSEYFDLYRNSHTVELLAARLTKKPYLVTLIGAWFQTHGNTTFFASS